MIEFRCKGCGRALSVADTLAGRRSRCKRCGAVMRIPPVPPTPVEPRKRGTRKPIAWEPWLSLGIGVGLTALYQSVPLLDMVVGCLATVIHELGHTAAAWLFCNPTVPAFDLKYG